VYLSDQGFYLGEHGWFDKRFMYEESLRTPFVIRYPQIIKPGTNITRFASNIDWAPTVLDLAGIKVPNEIQGMSLVPLLKNRNVKNWNDELYYHFLHKIGQDSSTAIATILNACTTYEAVKSAAGILLSSKDFKQLNQNLTNRWQKTCQELNMEEK
jgi:arylsulfatase A-like enzyme